MRKTKRFTAILLAAVLLGGCGNSGVPQEEYDKVVAERDELRNQPVKEMGENPARNFFEEIEGVSVAESGDSRRKSLVLTCYVKLYTDDEEVSTMATSIAEKLNDAQKEEWFDYDYILVDFWSESIGRIISMTLNANDLSEPMQINEWYEGEGQQQENPGKSGENGNEQEVQNKPSGQSSEESNGDVEILAEYTLPDSIGWYTMRFMVVKNNSSETVDISTSSLAYAEDGTMLAADDASFDALGAGCTSVFYEAFETDGKIDHYETDMKSQKSRYYESVIQDLSFVQNDIKDGAVFQVTNNGEDAAEFVEGYALFFLNGELVYYDSTYFVDDDSEIKPGETISKQMTSYEQFDTIEFYLTGRK